MIKDKRLEMYGGFWGGVAPLFFLIAILIWLSVGERGGTAPFWAAGWLAIALSLFLAKDKEHYCKAIMRGIGNENGVVIVTAWLFAGVFGQLMVAGGLVEGLLWFGLETGAQGAMFTLLAFIAASLFASGTGTGTGTVISLIPVLYPAGIYLGSDPAMLAVAILSGAALGDNLAPVSDTTIVSAYTQGAQMRNVVKSRFPLVIIAGIIAAVIFIIFGGAGGSATQPTIEVETNILGLTMLLSMVIVIIAAFAKRHIIEALIYGNISAMAIGLLNGNLKLAAIFSLPAKRGESTGLIQDGISGVTGAIIFALLVLAITQIVIESGVMDSVLKWALNNIVKSVRQAEFSILFVTFLVSIPIAANAPAILLVGPSFVKSIGEKFKLSAERTANLMDCAVCSIFYMIPWHIIVIVWYGVLTTASQEWNLPLPSIGSAFLHPYGWAIIAVLIFSVITGWNRKFANSEEEKSDPSIKMTI
ncbi:Na+/H+ antiporter NhaC family protein [Bacillus sp. JJ1773]|uniref:Na+/H+ antiporter NhaC family protein n=1 Tax=Bacillus sp. JJ1773 TaxID=3122965 RepID=UPI003000E096